MSGLAALLDAAAQASPTHVAVRDEAREVTFAALAARIERAAAGLAARGVAPGERVALLARNRVEFVEAYFALFALGAVAVPLNWRLRANEVAEQLADAGARLVLVDAACVPLVADFDGEVIGFDDGVGTPWCEVDAAPMPRAARPADEVAVQMYTSGTTGRAKGSMLSHANVDAMQRAWREDMPLAAEVSRFLQVTPLFHVGALLMTVSCVAARATLRLLPEFLAERALAVLRAEGITHALFVPAMLQWLLAERDVEQGGFDALELVVYGAAPMPVPVLERALVVFGCGFLQGYGLTETAGVLTTLTPADHRWPDGEPPPARLASAGRAVRCCEVRVVDEAGADVAVGAVGEVVARGANVHVGYWRREDADRDADGWFHTGDLARVDAEGYVTLVDRVKDMVCVAGENVYPREVELRLLEHAAVADVAVIGVPHRHWGEEVLALVVRAPGAAVTAPELVQHCRATLARFKCPTRVEWLDEVPRNAAGKIRKAHLREPWWRGRDRRV
ncbi:MAG: AMP-binding protein [Planctomycetes bacterium]|nr:AMP-binding protein [Planctomycetota bacterium]